MRCNRCKNILNRESTNYIWREDKKTVIIENTPVFSCEHCIEQFYANEVVNNINKVIEEISNLPIKVSVIDYKELKKYVINKK